MKRVEVHVVINLEEDDAEGHAELALLKHDLELDRDEGHVERFIITVDGVPL